MVLTVRAERGAEATLSLDIADYSMVVKAVSVIFLILIVIALVVIILIVIKKIKKRKSGVKS